MIESGEFRKYDKSVYMGYILLKRVCSLVGRIVCCFAMSAVWLEKFQFSGKIMICFKVNLILPAGRRKWKAFGL